LNSKIGAPDVIVDVVEIPSMGLKLYSDGFCLVQKMETISDDAYKEAVEIKFKEHQKIYPPNEFVHQISSIAQETIKLIDVNKLFEEQTQLYVGNLLQKCNLPYIPLKV